MVCDILSRYRQTNANRRGQNLNRHRCWSQFITDPEQWRTDKTARVPESLRKETHKRTDCGHKTSRILVDTYDKIVFEDLQIKNMMRNHHLSKSISDAGWYQLISLTRSKAEYAGKTVELVNPKGTSQVCICGCSVPKKLSMRIHNCPKCGLVSGRDHVSAMVIESRGNTAGTAGIKACPSSLSIDIMKQEAPSVREG